MPGQSQQEHPSSCLRTEPEVRLRKYPTDKKRLEEERQRYDDARTMTPDRYLQEVACRRTGEHDPTGTLAVTYRHRFKNYRKNPAANTYIIGIITAATGS